MKVGMIRCLQTEDYCPGTTDFAMIKNKQGAFKGVEGDIEIVGMVSCGRCPGKKAVLRAKELVNPGRGYHCLCVMHTKGNADRVCVPVCQEDERLCGQRGWRRHHHIGLYALKDLHA